MRKIDAFAHILPRSYLERLERQLEKTMAPSRLDYYREGVFSFDPVLTDLDARWRKIEPYGDYAQVLVLAVPPLEEVGPPAVAAEFARIANDEMAELVQRFPDRFAGFAAALPLSDVDEALRELDRALTQLGALGAQLYTNVLGVALDDPRFEPLFTRLEDAGRGVGRLSVREQVRLWPVVVTRLALRDRRRPVTPRLFRAHGASPAPARDRAPRWRHGAALLRPTRYGSRLSAGQGQTAAAAARILPEVPRRHGVVRRATRGPLRPRVLRPATSAIRHRHATWTLELGRGDDSGHRLGRPFQRGHGCGLLWERRAPARGAFRLTATSFVVRVAGVPERNPVTHDAGPTKQPRPLDCVLAEAVADGVDRCFEPVEARARGPTGSPAALSAPITSAAVEKEIRSILLGLIPTCVLTGTAPLDGG